VKTTDADFCMVETRAQTMANEKIEAIEKKLGWLVDQMKTLIDTIIKGKLALQLEEYGFNENLEGEFSHHLHFHEIHQHSHPRPPKLDMYKFDGSNMEIWFA